MRRIAIWNTAFLGDAVLTLPLIRALSAAFPGAALDFYVRKGLGGLFAAQPELAAVHEYDKRSGRSGPLALHRLGRELASRRYDVWVGAHQSPRSSLLALLSKARVRVGYSGSLLRRLCYTRLVERRFTRLHEIERLLRLAEPVLGASGLPLPETAPWPELVLPEAALAAAETFWRTGIHRPCLGLHPGSVWGTKRWTTDGFAQVARNALAEGAEVMIFAGPGEQEMAAEVISRIGAPPGTGKLHDLSGRLSLPELAAFIGRLDCYLGNDSGPLHLAWCQRVPVTALFGPTVRELGFFPRGANARVFEVPLPCRPCGLHGPQKCPLGHHRCMKDIGVAEVWADVRSKLFGPGRSPRTAVSAGSPSRQEV